MQIKKLNIMRKKWTNDELKELVSKYENGEDTGKLAKMFNCSNF